MAPIKNMMVSKFIAELIGTFVFLGVIIISVSGVSSNIYERADAWIHIGLALSVAILLMGKISGGHFNPAVSFMFFLNKEISAEQLLIYILAQLIGAALAYIMYNTFYLTTTSS